MTSLSAGSEASSQLEVRNPLTHTDITRLSSVSCQRERRVQGLVTEPAVRRQPAPTLDGVTDAVPEPNRIHFYWKEKKKGVKLIHSDARTHCQHIVTVWIHLAITSHVDRSQRGFFQPLTWFVASLMVVSRPGAHFPKQPPTNGLFSFRLLLSIRFRNSCTRPATRGGAQGTSSLNVVSMLCRSYHVIWLILLKYSHYGSLMFPAQQGLGCPPDPPLPNTPSAFYVSFMNVFLLLLDH